VRLIVAAFDRSPALAQDAFNWCGRRDRDIGESHSMVEMTERLLIDAGIGPGMRRVLDVGCGRGDVALIAAKLVGGQGEDNRALRPLAILHGARARSAPPPLGQVLLFP
jgi:protein-L-isoaspartate O-methyltransferase